MTYDPTKPYKSKILAAITETWKTDLVVKQLGGYIVTQQQSMPFEIDHTDGIGTKGIQHWHERSFAYAVTDAMAMNLNDLATIGARPFKLQNHIIFPEDDHDAIVAIVTELSRQCCLYKIAITGGETAIQNNLNGMDISITMTGHLFHKGEAVTDLAVVDVKPRPGDWLLGIKSNGLHSNGFTLARQFIEVSTLPTISYYNDVTAIRDKYDVHGAWHIAGGGFSRLKTPGLDMHVCVPYPCVAPVFRDLKKHIDDDTMYKTFNCGIGFVISASPEVGREIAAHSNFCHIGAVVNGSGSVLIISSFGGKDVVL